jgi:hypothetical protein
MNDSIAKALNLKTIAVVGLSKDPSKPSYDVASYLLSHGYHIVPVNPTADVILGERGYKSLLDLPEQIKHELGVVDIFRRPKDVPQIVDDALQLRLTYGRPLVIWMQLGIINESAAQKARNAGFEVVMDRCMKIELAHAK